MFVDCLKSCFGKTVDAPRHAGQNVDSILTIDDYNFKSLLSFNYFCTQSSLDNSTLRGISNSLYIVSKYMRFLQSKVLLKSATIVTLPVVINKGNSKFHGSVAVFRL